MTWCDTAPQVVAPQMLDLIDRFATPEEKAFWDYVQHNAPPDTTLWDAVYFALATFSYVVCSSSVRPSSVSSPCRPSSVVVRPSSVAMATVARARAPLPTARHRSAALL